MAAKRLKLWLFKTFSPARPIMVSQLFPSRFCMSQLPWLGRATRNATRATPLWKPRKTLLSEATGADLPCQKAPAPGAGSGQVAQQPGAMGRTSGAAGRGAARATRDARARDAPPHCGNRHYRACRSLEPATQTSPGDARRATHHPTVETSNALMLCIPSERNKHVFPAGPELAFRGC